MDDHEGLCAVIVLIIGGIPTIFRLGGVENEEGCFCCFDSVTVRFCLC